MNRDVGAAVAPAARPAGEPGIVMLESGGWGGIAHYSYNLCQALRQAGCRIALQTSAPYELDALPRSFDLFTFDESSSYRDRWRTLRTTLDGVDADLLHLQSTISARRDWLWLARLKRAGYKLVTTAHNILPHDRAERDAFGMRWAFSRIYRMSDGIIVHGEDTRRRIIEDFGVSEGRLAVIPHGDYRFAAGSHDRAEARERLGLGDDHLVLLAFGAMREYKGIPELIDAFARIAPEFPDARLLLIGKPIRVDADEYRRRILAARLGQRVILRPEYVPFNDIGYYFAACDAAVYPYRRIYQSGALQLAYGAGRPVVATRVGELAATVRDGWNGLLVPPLDVGALAAALRDMLSRTPDERAEMGRRSRQLAEDAHDWADVAATTVQLYRRAVRGSPAAV